MITGVFSGKNLRWLFAETLVIVLGVLIALGLDDYRTETTERRLAIGYIQRIEQDLLRDTQYLNEVWYPRLKLKRESMEAVAPVVRNQVPLPDDTTTFLINVARGGMMGASVTGWITDTTFLDMRATGNLRLIQSPEIRGKISDYYEGVDSLVKRIQSRLTDYISFVHSVLPAELRNDIDRQSLMNFGTDFAIEQLTSDEFRRLFNEEYNLLLFMEGQDLARFSQSLLSDLSAYRIELEEQ